MSSETLAADLHQANSMVLPPLYAGWVSELLGGAIPEETGATCQNCAMCSGRCGDGGEDPEDRGATFFSPDTKCCTYTPRLANFLVGRVLLDESPRASFGRSTLRERMKAGVSVSPLGIDTPRRFSLLYGRSKTAFGRSRSLRCPHYSDEDGGRCGVWKHRSAVCSTWFCKYNRGRVGKHFWEQLERLLSLIETSVSGWCARELDVGADALKELYPARQSETDSLTEHELDGRPDNERLSKAWGSWWGHEEEFFERCAALVEALAWSDILRIGGSPLQIRADLVRHAYSNLVSYQLPERTRVGKLNIIGQRRDNVRVYSYSENDPLDLPKTLAMSLHYFDRESVETAREQLAEEQALELEPAVVRKLLDFEILMDDPR